MPKKPTDQEAIQANTAIEVLNLVRYGGKSREPASAFPQEAMEFMPGDAANEDPNTVKAWEENVPIGVAKILAREGTQKFLDAWKTFLIGGSGELYGRSDVEHVPGLLTFPQETMEAIPAPPFGKVHAGGNLIDWFSRQGFPLLGRDEPSRKLVTDPIIVGAVVPGMLKTLGREAAGSALADYSRNSLQWSMKTVMKVGDETGQALNLTPKIHEMWKAARDASRLKWTKGYDAIENGIWNKMRTEKLGGVFNGDMRNFLKSNFETSRVKWGEGLSDAFRDVSTARLLAQIKTLPTAERLREVTSAADNLAISRYMRPRVVGGEKVWPEHLSKKFADDLHKGGYEVFQPDIKLYLDNHTAYKDKVMGEIVDLNMGSRSVHAEYQGVWYPRKFQDKGFIDTRVKGPGAPAPKLYTARDSYAARVKMTKEEAEALMKGTGGKGSAKAGTDLTKGRAELDPIYSGEEAGVSLVQFSPKQYGGSESAAAAARDEFVKRAQLAGYGGGKIGKVGVTEIKSGILVRASDKGNVGTVISVDEAAGTARVKFVNKADGTQATKTLPLDQLKRKNIKGKAKRIKKGDIETSDPFTEEELAEMGELTNAADNMFSAVEVLEKRAAKGRLFRTIDRLPDNAGSMTAEEAAEAGVDSGLLGWHRLPNTNSWGDLAGKYIEPDLYRKMVEMDNTLLGPGMRIYRHVVKNNKAALTIWSAPTWMRNFFGNMGFSAGGSCTPPWGGGFHNWKVYKDAVFTKFGSPRHVEYIKHGIDGVQLGQAELGMGKEGTARLTLFENMFGSKGVPSEASIGDSIVEMMRHLPYGPKSVLTKSASAKNLSKGYGSIDTLHRRAMYNKAVDVWKWDVARAVEHVNKFTQNYVEVPNAIRMTRQMPGGAMFGAFPAESTRIGRNMIRENPVAAALAMGGAAFAMSRAHKWMSGMSDEEYEGKVRNHGLFHVTYPFRNDRGNFESVPTDYINPFGWALSAWFGNRWTKKEEQEAGASGWDAQVMRFMGVMRSFALNETAFNLAGGAVARTDLFTGRPIQEEGEKIVPAYAEWFAQQTLPSQAPPYGRHYKEQVDLVQGRAGYKGKERTAVDTFLKTVVGLGSQEYDPEIEIERWRDQSKWAVGEMKRQINAKRRKHSENTEGKTAQESKFFDDELRQQTSVIAEKYAAIIREGKERKFLAMIVQAQRDMERGEKPTYDIAETKKLLDDVRAKRDMPGTQRKIEGGQR